MTHDISTFMTWFINQFITLMTWCFTQLDNIQFAGTSLLKLVIGIAVISLFIPVFLALPKGVRTTGERTIDRSKRK